MWTLRFPHIRQEIENIWRQERWNEVITARIWRELIKMWPFINYLRFRTSRNFKYMNYCIFHFYYYVEKRKRGVFSWMFVCFNVFLLDKHVCLFPTGWCIRVCKKVGGGASWRNIFNIDWDCQSCIDQLSPRFFIYKLGDVPSLPWGAGKWQI